MANAVRFDFSRYWISVVLTVVSLALASCGGHGGTDSAGVAPEAPPVRTPVPRPTHEPDGPPEPAPTPHPDLSYLKLGTYGGQNELVTIGKKDVKFQVPCAVGHVAAPVQAEDGGIFDTNGTFQALSGRRLTGPVLSARFFGFVDGGHLHFEITHSDPQGDFSDVTYDADLRARAMFTQACSRELSAQDPGTDAGAVP
jgi:hypothetical protein